MKIREHGRKVDTVPALVLFAVFAVCILSVLLTGAEVYQRLSERDLASHDWRTAGQYLATRVRQADRLGGVAVADFGGADALVFPEEVDGAAYETRVYCYDGYLRELFAAAGGDFAPEDGEKVLEAQALSLHRSGSVLTAELTDATGQTRRLTLYLRSGEGASA